DFAVFALSGALGGAVDEPADHSPAEDGQGGSDGQVGSYGEGERADAEQLDGDDEADADQHDSPGQLAREDAVDDGGHEAGLRGGCTGAADALNPLDGDFACGGRVEIFAVLELGGADGIEDEQAGGFLICGGFAVRGDDADVSGRVIVVLDDDAGMRGVDVPGLVEGVELLQAGVHEVEGEPDDDGGDDNADHQRDLLQAGRGADDVAGLEVLRGVARVGGGDADHAADGDG